MSEKKKRAIRAYRVMRHETLLERYGKAYLRLEGWEWDELAGPKPPGFDQLTDVERVEIIKQKKEEFRFILGDVYTHYMQWTQDRKLSEQSWIDYRKRMWANGFRYVQSYRDLYQFDSLKISNESKKPVQNPGQSKNGKSNRHVKLSKFAALLKKLFVV